MAGDVEDGAERLAWTFDSSDAPITARLAPHAAGEARSFQDAGDDPTGRVIAALKGFEASLRDMRALMATQLAEVRADMTGLRHVVLDWPELADVAAGLTELRESIGAELSAAEQTARQGREELAEALATAVAAIPPAAAPTIPRGAVSLSALKPLVEEISSLREQVVGLSDEVAQLRRRISLRAPQ